MPDEPEPQLRPLIGFEALRELLGISPVTGARLLAEGRLPAYHVRGQWRFDPDEVLAALRAEPGERVQPRKGGVRGPYKRKPDEVPA